jgi:hypothetical protein
LELVANVLKQAVHFTHVIIVRRYYEEEEEKSSCIPKLKSDN